jgi:hypothetical protein
MGVSAKRADRFDGVLFVRCPPALPQMIASAAQEGMTTISDYVRSAVLVRLRRDGFGNPAPAVQEHNSGPSASSPPSVCNAPFGA